MTHIVSFKVFLQSVWDVSPTWTHSQPSWSLYIHVPHVGIAILNLFHHLLLSWQLSLPPAVWMCFTSFCCKSSSQFFLGVSICVWSSGESICLSLPLYFFAPPTSPVRTQPTKQPHPGSMSCTGDGTPQCDVRFVR